MAGQTIDGWKALHPMLIHLIAVLRINVLVQDSHPIVLSLIRVWFREHVLPPAPLPAHFDEAAVLGTANETDGVKVAEHE
jgi:hypothetical protein